jgi:hypothetical protein
MPSRLPQREARLTAMEVTNSGQSSLSRSRSIPERWSSPNAPPTNPLAALDEPRAHRHDKSYKQSLWIIQSFSNTNLDLHCGLPSLLLGRRSLALLRKNRAHLIALICVQQLIWVVSLIDNCLNAQCYTRIQKTFPDRDCNSTYIGNRAGKTRLHFRGHKIVE